MSTESQTPAQTSAHTERTDLLDTLHKHRGLLRHTVAGLTDEQARSRPTVSELCLGGLVKHLAAVEAQWARFVQDGPDDAPAVDWENVDWSNPSAEVVAYAEGFSMRDDETLVGLMAAYDAGAAATDALVATADLEARQPLPQAPWNSPGESWSARRVFLHVVAETAQHAGHADIIRETIDGQKSMG